MVYKIDKYLHDIYQSFEEPIRDVGKRLERKLLSRKWIERISKVDFKDRREQDNVCSLVESPYRGTTSGDCGMWSVFAVVLIDNNACSLWLSGAQDVVLNMSECCVSTRNNALTVYAQPHVVVEKCQACGQEVAVTKHTRTLKSALFAIIMYQQVIFLSSITFIIKMELPFET